MEMKQYMKVPRRLNLSELKYQSLRAKFADQSSSHSSYSLLVE